MFTVYAQDKTKPGAPKYYRVRLTPRQATRWNNGMLVSIGLIVGEFGFTASSLARLQRAGAAQEVTQDEWNHSGCQSSCIRRGNARCGW